MSSLTTKANKSRSVASPKLATKSNKKTLKQEVKRPLPAKTSTKSSKAVSAKGSKTIAVSKKVSAPKVFAKPVAAKALKKLPSKPVAAKGKAVAVVKSKVVVAKSKPVAAKPVAAKSVVAAKSKAVAVAKAKPVVTKSKVVTKNQKAVLKKVAPKTAARLSKPVEVPVKKTATPNALAAVSSFEQALKLFNKHDYAAAKEVFERIIQKFGEQTDIVMSVRRYLAICVQKLARTPAAPKNADALYDQGVFELNKANVREAIQLFEKALKAQPTAAHVLYSLAAAYARVETPRKALEVLRKAIQLQPVHRSRARTDQDFASLHNDEEFQNLTGYGLGFFED